MSVHIGDLLDVQIDLITRGMPLPMTAERRLFADGLEHEAFDDEDDEDEDDRDPRRDDDRADLVELFRRNDR